MYVSWCGDEPMQCQRTWISHNFCEHEIKNDERAWGILSHCAFVLQLNLGNALKRRKRILPGVSFRTRQPQLPTPLLPSGPGISAVQPVAKFCLGATANGRLIISSRPFVLLIKAFHWYFSRAMHDICVCKCSRLFPLSVTFSKPLLQTFYDNHHINFVRKAICPSKGLGFFGGAKLNPMPLSQHFVSAYNTNLNLPTTH